MNFHALTSPTHSTLPSSTVTELLFLVAVPDFRWENYPNVPKAWRAGNGFPDSSSSEALAQDLDVDSCQPLLALFPLHRHSSMLQHCRRVDVVCYRVDVSAQPEPLRHWTSPRCTPVCQRLLAPTHGCSTRPSLGVLNVLIKQPEPLQLPVPLCTAEAGLSLCPQGDNKWICSTANRNNLTSISSAPNFSIRKPIWLNF